MRTAMLRIARTCLVLVVFVLGACQSETWQDDDDDWAVVTPESPVYLEEVIPPCVPLEGTQKDPCLPGPSVPAPSGVAGGAMATPLFVDEPPTVVEIMFGQPGSTTRLPSLIKHVVIRGTVMVDTARCNDYYLKAANYETDKSNEGLIRIHCFSDVRVNEYLVGTGPPVLTVGLYVSVTTFSDREGYLDREETIAFYGGEDVWIANLFDDPAAWVNQTYGGQELVLFLSLPFAITLEAFVVNNLFSLWFVQRDDSGTLWAVSPSKQYIWEPAKRDEADMLLTDLEREIVEAAASRDEITGGRIGTDPSLPMLVTDANDLRSHYTDIGAVYITTETNGEDVEHPTRLPPPAPGDDEPDQPPITTGEEDDGSPGTPPVPGGGEEDQGGNTGGGTGP